MRWTITRYEASTRVGPVSIARKLAKATKVPRSIRPAITEAPPKPSSAICPSTGSASMVAPGIACEMAAPMRTRTICRDCLSSHFSSRSSAAQDLTTEICASTSRMCSVRFASRSDASPVWAKTRRRARRAVTASPASTTTTMSVIAGDIHSITDRPAI